MVRKIGTSGKKYWITDIGKTAANPKRIAINSWVTLILKILVKRTNEIIKGKKHKAIPKYTIEFTSFY